MAAQSGQQKAGLQVPTAKYWGHLMLQMGTNGPGNNVLHDVVPREGLFASSGPYSGRGPGNACL